MKKLIFLFLPLAILTQCHEEKPLIEKAIEARCQCLKNFDKEKNYILEVMQCSDKVNERVEFKGLDPTKIMEGMEKTCPDAALPLDEMVQ
jgi:hypothetical protein